MKIDSNTHDMDPVNLAGNLQNGINAIDLMITSNTPPNCGGSQLWLTWDGEMSPPSTEYYPIIENYSISRPIPGTKYSVPFIVQPWMHQLNGTIRQGSHGNISFISPDGTVYSKGSPNVEYIETTAYSFLALNDVASGEWQLVVDTIAAEDTSIFFVSVGGSQGTIPSVDSVAPFSTIHISGTKGQNEWYVSDVQVELTAEDNPGGSGIARIEYSLDRGVSWQTYNGIFYVAQEGANKLMSRAIDGTGNIEHQPAIKFFNIDKTPPTVKPWTDVDTYTRVDPFTVHVDVADPIPGSGVCSESARLDNMAVANNQVIDLLFFHIGQHTVSATATDCAGWTTDSSVNWNLVATIESMKAGLTRFCSEGYITNKGICNSLQQKLDAAKAARDRGQYKTAINILGAFNAEVSAQDAKKIPPNVATLLHEDANYVIDVLKAAP
jgi:hypothetical protein